MPSDLKSPFRSFREKNRPLRSLFGLLRKPYIPLRQTPHIFNAVLVFRHSRHLLERDVQSESNSTLRTASDQDDF